MVFFEYRVFFVVFVHCGVSMGREWCVCCVCVGGGGRLV